MPAGFDLNAMATNARNTVARVVNDTGLARNVSGVVAPSASQIQQVTNRLPGQVSSNVRDTLGAFNINLSSLIKAPSMSAVALPADSLPPYPNPLNIFASYTYIITLSVLDDNSVNNPDTTYRTGIPQKIICKSASGEPDNRVKTAYGQFDFFIDNLNIESIFGHDKATGNTNATTMNFTVVEPYSMGLFMQSLSVAAAEVDPNNSSYIEAPCLLTIQFRGFTEQNETVDLPEFTRYQPIKLSNVTMKVTGKGSTYNVEALAWNDFAFSDRYKKFKDTISVRGKTVQEALQTGEKSLQVVMNRINAVQSEDSNKPATVTDKILILFPVDLASSSTNNSTNPNQRESTNTATVNPSSASNSQSLFQKLGVTASGQNNFTQSTESCNALGAASLGFDASRKGDQAFGKDGKVYDATTGNYIQGNIDYDPATSEFKFTQDTDIINAINQIILMSDYARQAIKGDMIDANGFLPWWRIETQLYQMSSTEYATKTGTKPRLVVYRVVPYKVHSSKIMPANTPAPGFKKLKDQCIKQYEYIYTGKNVDILDFDISIQASFFNSYAADGGNKSTDIKEQATQSGVDAPDGKIPKVTGEPTAPVGSVGSRVLPVATKFSTDRLGAGGPEDAGTRIARQYHDAFMEGNDMLTMDMKIIGDPYYIGDSGQGNYTAKAVKDYQNINEDGAIDYQTSEVDIVVNFKTPVDINQKAGMYDFGDAKLLMNYSGMFKVMTVTHRFAGGKFLQDLHLMRRPMQEAAEEYAAQGKDSVSKVPSAEPTYAPDTTNATTFNSSTNANVLSAITRNNNAQPSNAAPALPGVVNTGTVTI
jgi:hypothetical protein